MECLVGDAQAGFLTPTSLHYVRNHGVVPRAAWDAWKIDVSGLVRRPTSYTMKDMLRFPARELPVTLVCAGNRRKEENMVKQSIGFNWGAAAVSTSIWRGVRLCDVLRHCGVFSRKKGALYVCFEGAETLPGTEVAMRKPLRQRSFVRAKSTMLRCSHHHQRARFVQMTELCSRSLIYGVFCAPMQVVEDPSTGRASPSMLQWTKRRT